VVYFRTGWRRSSIRPGGARLERSRTGRGDRSRDLRSRLRDPGRTRSGPFDEIGRRGRSPDEGAGRAIDLALEDAGLEADEVKDLFVEAHATGTGADIGEFRTITERFHKKQVVGMSSIKVDTGHTFGAAGTLGVITGANVLRDNVIPGHRTMTDENRAPETLGWPLVPGRAQKVRNVGKVMINGFGFGGKNRVVILGKPD